MSTWTSFFRILTVSNCEFNANFLGLYHMLFALDTIGVSYIIIWWLTFDKTSFQFWREILIWVLVILLQLYLKIKFLTLFQDQNVENDVLNLTSPDRYELSWFLPEDNGIPIDFFEVSFYPVTYDTSNMRWERHGNLFRTEIPHPGNVRYLITNLYPNTHHLIEIRAHNQEGYSTSSALVIKTARGEFFFFRFRLLICYVALIRLPKV